MKKTQEEKIEYLKRLLEVYLKFSRHYSMVEIKLKSGDVEIKWFAPKHEWYTFEAISFPLSDLDKRIEHYKNKVKLAYKKKH